MAKKRGFFTQSIPVCRFYPVSADYSCFHGISGHCAVGAFFLWFPVFFRDAAGAPFLFLEADFAQGHAVWESGYR